MTSPDDEPRSRMNFETAGAHVARRVPVAAPQAAAGEVRAGMAGQRYECATDVAVCVDGRLVGLVPAETLLAAAPQTRIHDIMDPEPPVIGPGADQELAAWTAVQHGESSLAVVDEAGRFVGVIPPHRLLAVLLAEHHEDMARLSGMLRDALSAKRSLQEPVWRRFAHRVPWLAVGLIGVLLAADLIAAFERQIQASLILAFFLPAIVYLADAVGTQTEALVIRGLSVGVPIRRVVRQEIVTGVLIGVGLALLAMPFALWRWDSGGFVAVLGLSLVGACSTATAVAIGLPWLLDRFGRDPAFGSGPLATVIQDLLSILIYLTIATLLGP